MLKILQLMLQQYVNHELPDGQAEFRRVIGTRFQIANIRCIIEKAIKFQKKHLLYWLCQSLRLSVSQQTVENSSRDGNTRLLPASWEICMQVKKEQLELGMQQQTGSKLGKVYVKDVHCHPAHLTYMQSTSCEMSGWMNYKLESRFLGEISITSDMQMTSPLCQKVNKN